MNNTDPMNHHTSAHIAATALIVSIFCIAAFFTYPIADDYSYALKVRNTPFTEYLVNFYMTWSGRYASNILIPLLEPLNRHIILYQTLPLLLIVTFFGGTLAAFSTACKNSFRDKVLFSLIITCIFFTASVTLRQSLYWMSGSLTYQISFSFFPILLACLFHLALAKTPRHTLLWPFLFLSLFLCCGATEMICLGVLLTTYTAVGIAYLNNHHAKRTFLIVAFVTTLFALASFLAPGNFARATNSPHINASILNKILLCLGGGVSGAFESFKWFFLSPFIPGVLFICMHMKPKSKTQLPLAKGSTKHNAYSIFIILLFILFAIYFLAYAAIGGYPYARVRSGIFATAIILGSVGILLFCADISTRLHKLASSHALSKITFGTFIAISLAMPNTSLTLYNLANGDLLRYRNLKQEQQEIARKHTQRPAIIPVSSNHPHPVWFRALDDPKRTWLAGVYKDYWRLTSITFEHRN